MDGTGDRFDHQLQRHVPRQADAHAGIDKRFDDIDTRLDNLESKIDRVIPRIREVLVYWKTIIRSGIIGTIIGAIPGVGEGRKKALLRQTGKPATIGMFDESNAPR